MVRDWHLDRFLAAHRVLFEPRDRDAADLRRRDVIASVLDAEGVDSAAGFGEVDAGWPLETYRKEHTTAADTLQVFGVPTVIYEDRATFVRIMDRGKAQQGLVDHHSDRGSGHPPADASRAVDLRATAEAARPTPTPTPLPLAAPSADTAGSGNSKAALSGASRATAAASIEPRSIS